MINKKIIAIGTGIGSLLFASAANAQFATTTVTTILSDTLTDAGSILEVNLPTIFVFLIAISAVFMFFRWVRGVIRRPR